MTVALSILTFLLGVYLSVRLAAALFRVIDLWYARQREWPRMLRGIAGWGGTAAVALLALPDPDPLVWGLAAYAAFFVGSYLLASAIVRLSVRDRLPAGGHRQ